MTQPSRNTVLSRLKEILELEKTRGKKLNHYPIGSMGLVYLPIHFPWKSSIHVGKYTLWESLLYWLHFRTFPIFHHVDFPWHIIKLVMVDGILLDSFENLKPESVWNKNHQQNVPRSSQKKANVVFSGLFLVIFFAQILDPGKIQVVSCVSCSHLNKKYHDYPWLSKSI